MTPRERAAAAAAACAPPCNVAVALNLLVFDWTGEGVCADAANVAGAALLHLGQIDAACAALDHAASLPGLSDRGACLLNLARARTLCGDPARALDLLRQAEGLLVPRPALWVQSTADALLSLGRTDEALTLIPDDPGDADLAKTRVLLLGAANRHQDAADFVRRAIANHPDNLELILLACELASLRGRSGEAAAMLRKALALHPDDISLLARQAMLASPFHVSEESRTAAKRAMELAQAQDSAVLRALACCAQAHVLGTQDCVQEAETAWRAALDHAPDHVPALSGLGNLLLTNGRVDDAIALFRRVRAISPLHGWSQLIQAREVPDNPAVLDDIARTAMLPGLEGPVRTALLFLLASAHDRRREYGTAFDYAQQANEASKPLLLYAPQNHRAEVDRIIARFSAAFVAARKGWGNPSTVPVFIVGMPRSGTTLAEQILAGHSQIHGAGELGLSADAIARLNQWERKLGSGAAYPECVADLTQRDIERMAAIWLERLREHDPDARFIIDKLPHNFENIGLIRLMFPNARILSCRRDPRDVAVSNYVTDYAAKFGGMGFAYDLGWIGEQIVDHDRVMAHWHAVFPGAILDVVYEDTVNDTEAQARRMLAFLGLEWEPGVLAFQSLDRPVKTASTWQVRQPVYTSSKARWRHYADHLGPLDQALAHVPPPPVPMPLPTVPPGLFLRAMDLLKRGQAGRAEQAFVQLIAAAPHHAAAYHFLGVAQAQQGRLGDAREAIRHAVSLHPFHAAWFDNLARVEQAAGRTAEAQAAAAQAQKLRSFSSPETDLAPV